MFEAVKVALDPTPRQARLLCSHAGAARFAYNAGLAHVKDMLENGEPPEWSHYALVRWRNANFTIFFELSQAKAHKRRCLMATKTARRVALMSIHPRYAHAILDGRKTVEFRKRPLAPDVSHVVVYSTAPDRKVLGYFEIDKQVELSPEALWEQYGDRGLIEKEAFFSYYEGRATGVGILVKRVFRCEQSRSLSDIGVATPPQSFQYLSEDALQVLA